MDRIKFFMFLVILALSIPYTYGGCVLVFSTGDIEEKDDTNDTITSTAFTGSTSPATITSANARDLAVGALVADSSYADASNEGLGQGSTMAPAGTFRLLRFPLVLQGSLGKTGKTPPPGASLIPAVQTRRGTLAGSCGGRLSYQFDFLERLRSFNGSFSFRNYCDRGITISGETDIDGTYRPDTGDFTSANFFFTDLRDDRISWDGELSIDILDPWTTASLSAHSQAIESGQVFWLEDYTMNITEFAGFIEIKVFGTFYHPDQGSVELFTTAPFIVHNEDQWPTSGQLLIQGTANTQAELNFLDQMSAYVEADTDGDGGFDWESGRFIWADR